MNASLTDMLWVLAGAFLTLVEIALLTRWTLTEWRGESSGVPPASPAGELPGALPR